MYRRRNKAFIIFMILAVVLLISAIVYFNSQRNLKKEYKAIKNGPQTRAARVYVLDDSEQAAEQGYQVKWRFVFNVEGSTKTYMAVTVHGYTKDYMEVLTKNGGLLINYRLDNNGLPMRVSYDDDSFICLDQDGKVVSKSDERATTVCYSVVSYETIFFENSRPPALTSSIVLFALFAGCLIFAFYNYFVNKFLKSIERNGELAYGYFIEAKSSKFGPNRYMSVKYRFQNALDEWVEAVSPYAFNTLEAEALKELDAIKIKYRGNHSVIIEDVKNIRV